MSNNKDNHIVSVIIPTINRNSLSEVLEALKNQSRQPDEIIVMEDKNRRDPSIMRNEGIEKSKGDLLAFLDDDNVPEEDWLETFINNIDKYQAECVSSNYIEEDPFLNEVRVRRKFPEVPIVNPNGFFGTGGNCMYGRTVLEECKNRHKLIFDPKIKISQNIELAWRLRSQGFKLVYVINNVRHLKKLNPTQFINFQYHRGKGIGELYILRNSYKDISVGPGLLWDNYAPQNPAKKWLNVIWQRIFGPFDYKSFSKFQYFILFWIGEKAKALGFLFTLIKEKIHERDSSANQHE